MILDQEKFNRQVQIVKDWIAVNRAGILEAATGFGKTFTAMLCIKHIKKYFPEENAIVVVPTNYLKNQWITRLKANKLYDNVTVETIQSKPEGKYGLLILDEVHRFTGPEFSKVFDSIDYKYILGASATIDETNPKMKLIKSRAPIFHTVPLEECLEKNWVADFKVFCLGLDIPDVDREPIDKIKEKISKYMSYFSYDDDSSFTTIQRCIKDTNYRNSYAKSIGENPNTVRNMAFNALKAINARKQILYNHPVKIKAVKKVTERFSDKKFIMFCESINFVKDLAKEIPDSIQYHSDLPTRLVNEDLDVVGESTKLKNKTYYYLFSDPKKLYSAKELPKNLKRVAPKRYINDEIKRFENNEVNKLITAKALDEGADIENVNFTIEISGSGKKLQSLQRRGRSLRKAKGKITINLIIYIIDSQEEKWVSSKLKGTPNIHYITDIEDITV